jgi:hypothetical protein
VTVLGSVRLFGAGWCAAFYTPSWPAQLAQRRTPMPAEGRLSFHGVIFRASKANPKTVFKTVAFVRSAILP